MGKAILTEPMLSVNFSTVHPSGSSVPLLTQIRPPVAFSWCALLLAPTFHNNSEDYNNKPPECRLPSYCRAKPNAR